MLGEAVLLLFALAFVVLVWRLHLSHWPSLKLFWAGLACYLGWGLFLSLVPGGAHMRWYWLFLDAPLNVGWIFCWAWPVFWPEWQRSRAHWRETRARFRALRQLVQEIRASK